MPLQVSNHHKIAIIRRNGLGDLLCTMPLLSYLKQQAPEAHLSLLVDQRNACLAPYLEGYDRLVVLPPGNRYLSLLKLALQARKWDLDFAISAKASPMKLMNLMLFALQAKQRFAWADSSWHSCLINCPQLYEGYDIHQALQILRLVAPELNEIPQELYPKLKIPATLHQQYAPIIQERLASLKNNRKALLLISVTNNRADRSLGIEAHAAILNEAFKTQAFNVVISAEIQQAEIAQELSTRLQMPNLSVVTASFDEFIQLLNSVDLLLLGDSGVAHLAAALNKAQVVLFGKTRLERWHPLSEKAICFHHPIDVKEIPQAQVIDALHQQLRNFYEQN